MAPIRSRVELTDLAAPNNLRPVQKAVDTYAPPAKAPIDNDSQRLAEALQGFSARLASFVKPTKPEEDPRLAEVYRVMSSSKDPDMVAGLANGTLPHMDVPHARALYEKDAGERVGRMALEDLRLGVQDGTVPLVDTEGRPVDVQALIADRAAKNSEPFKGSLHFQKAFAGVVESNRNALGDMVRGKVAEVNKERNTVMVKSALEDVVRMSVEGRDDDQLRKAINERTEAAYKVTGVRPSDTQALLLGRVRELAKQDPDAAERLLKLDRGKGFDGQEIGSLAGNPAYRKEVGEIAEAINEERANRFDVSERQRLSADARARLEKGDGSFATITNHSYTNPFDARNPAKNPQRMVTRESIQDATLSEFLRDSDYAFRRQGANGPASVETKFRREYEVFVNANRPHPVWAATLQTTGRILTNPASLSDPANVAKVAAASELYNTLAARNPAYATETLGVQERERKFYDQYNVYRRTLGDPENEAARKAAEFINNPPPPLTGDEVKELRDKADRIDLNGWARGGKATSWFGELGAQNINILRGQVFDTARAIAADRKVPVDKVMDAAVERVAARSTLFNGQIIPPNAHLTNESKPFFQKRVDELYEANKDILQSMGYGSSQDLSLREEVPGIFRLVGSDGSSVIIPNLNKDGSVKGYDTLRVNSKDIDTIRAQTRQEALDKALKDSEIAADRKVINTPNFVDGKGIVPNPNAPTKQQREEASKREKERNPPVPQRGIDFNSP